MKFEGRAFTGQMLNETEMQRLKVGLPKVAEEQRSGRESHVVSSPILILV
jgi:hypothetical protein